MKILQALPVAALLLISGVVGWAIAPDVTFSRVYETRGYFSQISLADTTSQTGAFLGGNALEGQFQFWVQRVDSAGDTVWNSQLGTTDQLLGMTLSSSADEIVLVGSTYESGSMDFRHVRLALDGGTEVNVDDGSPGFSEQLTAVSAHPGASTAGEYALGEIRPGEDVADVVVRSLAATGAIIGDRVYAEGRYGSALLGYRNGQNELRLLICGTADSLVGRSRDFWLVRTDSLFTDSTEVHRRFGGAQHEACLDAARLSSQLTILVGTSRSFGDSVNGDIWLVATNDNGDSLWSRLWRTPGVDVAYGVAATQDFDSGFVIAGYTRSTPSSPQRGILAKYNLRGDSLWTLYVDGAAGAVLFDVAQDRGYHYRAVGAQIQEQAQHGLYVVTDADPHSPGQHPPNRFSLLYPLSSDTVTNDTVYFDWEDATEPDGEGIRYALLIDSDSLFQAPVQVYGPLNVSRFTWPADSDEAVIYWRVVAQDDHNLTRICEQRYQAFLRLIPDSTEPFDLAAPDSGLALPQSSAEFSWTPARDPDSNDGVSYTVHFQTGDTTVSFPALADTFMIVSFANNPIFPDVSPVTWWVTASSLYPPMTLDSRQRWNFITWSAGADGGVELPLEFGLAKVYPNPFNTVVNLEFALEHPAQASLNIFDLQGRLVETVVRGFMTAGQYRMRWDGTAHGSGTYFARLSADARVATVKLTLLK
ncbi:T9SS type A sorting domain-containing protein [candidate division KSB1 bacterium]|nr:T9SS type A sorting domain-containing protein [candidate division KSB1 bacterium]